MLLLANQEVGCCQKERKKGTAAVAVGDEVFVLLYWMLLLFSTLLKCVLLPE